MTTKSIISAATICSIWALASCDLPAPVEPLPEAGPGICDVIESYQFESYDELAAIEAAAPKFLRWALTVLVARRAECPDRTVA